MTHSSKKALRVVTFNVHHGKNIDRIVDTFKNNPILCEADVIYFQEIEDHKIENNSRAKMIAEQLSLQHVYAPARNLITAGTHGVAILSKYSLFDAEVITLPKNTMYPRSRNRIALNASIDVDGEIIQLSNIHLDTRLNTVDRLDQLRGLINKLKEHKTKKIILGGDFNTLPFRFYKTVPIAYINQKKVLHNYLKEEDFLVYQEETTSTFKKGLISWDLDGLYLRNLSAIRGGVEKSVRASDHKPLWLDVEF